MTARTIDQNGWFEIKRNPITRAGVFDYRGSQIGAPEPDRMYKVLRPPEELSDPVSLDSFRLMPIVDDHHMLGSADVGLMPAEEKGVHGVIGDNVVYDFSEDIVYSNIKVFSQSLAEAIRSGKREFSAGYRCVYDFSPGEYKGVRYDVVQRKQRGNHLALVTAGRMGPDIAVLDHMTFTVDAKDLEEMTKKTPLELARAALKTAQDAKAPDTVIAACDAAVKALDTETSEAEKADADAEKEAADKRAADELAAKEKADKEATDKLAADAAERAKAAGLDAVAILAGDLAKANATVIAQDARLKVLETAGASALDSKTVFAEMGAKSKLADDLSWHIGTFDHAGMGLDEVAKYGVEKLKLEGVVAGQEQAALNVYLQMAKRPTPANAADAEDAAEPDFVKRHEARKSA